MLSRCILLCLLALSLRGTAGAQPYENLVLEGGGIRGIAYAGALQVLEERGQTAGIRRVAGTSVGGIVGTLFALGYTPGEMQAILDDLQINTFNDGRWIFFGGQSRLRKRYGWYRGDRLEAWIGKQIAARTGSENTTFGELRTLAAKDKRFRELYLTATDLRGQRAVVFCADSFPHMALRTAVRATVSIPVYFTAVLLDGQGRRYPTPKSCPDCGVFVDGGVLMNYPISLFDSSGNNGLISNPRTLGLKLEREAQMALNAADGSIAPYPINGIAGYVGALYNICMEGLNRNVPFGAEQFRTVYINTSDINPRVRRISPAQKRRLFDNGVAGARKFLEAAR